MIRRLWILVLLALTALSVYGCSGDDPPAEACESGQVIGCSCPMGAVGSEACGKDGTWGSCSCSDGDASASTPGFEEHDSSCLGTSVATVEFKGRTFDELTQVKVFGQLNDPFDAGPNPWTGPKPFSIGPGSGQVSVSCQQLMDGGFGFQLKFILKL